MKGDSLLIRVSCF